MILSFSSKSLVFHFLFVWKSIEKFEAANGGFKLVLGVDSAIMSMSSVEARSNESE
jgi:hypothetical protein